MRLFGKRTWQQSSFNLTLSFPHDHPIVGDNDCDLGAQNITIRTDNKVVVIAGSKNEVVRLSARKNTVDSATPVGKMMAVVKVGTH